MNTEQLIQAMAADTKATRPVETVLPLTLLAVAAVAGFAFLRDMGARSDLAQALTHGMVLVKHAFPVLLLIGAFAASVRLSRPGGHMGASLAVLAAVPLILSGAVAYEILTMPEAGWRAAFTGSSRPQCLTSISLMTIPMLAGTLWAMKRGASTRPALSGALAGLLSSSTAAALYALYCTEDSPLFFAFWYLIPIIGATALGAMLGAKLLRW